MNFCLLAKKIRGSPFTVNPGLFWAVFLQPLVVRIGSGAARAGIAATAVAATAVAVIIREKDNNYEKNYPPGIVIASE